MTAPWSTLKPSTAPRLSQGEIEALPAGMVVFASSQNGSAIITGPGLCRFWTAHGWSKVDDRIGFLDFVWLPLLPRMSFALTAEAVRERRKDVTRRLELPRWWKPGVWFLGVDKIRQAGAQGLCVAQCGLANKEPLVAISQSEVVREGFPNSTPEGFCAVFRATTPRDWDGWVWRLPFRYVELPG